MSSRVRVVVIFDAIEEKFPFSNGRLCDVMDFTLAIEAALDMEVAEVFSEVDQERPLDVRS